MDFSRIVIKVVNCNSNGCWFLLSIWSAGATMTTPSTGNGLEEIKPNPGSGKH